MPFQFRPLLSFALAVASALTAAQSISTPPAGPHPRIKSGESARTRLHNDLVARGQAAEARGEYVTAESLYQDACDLNPRLPFDRLFLARLYDRQGRDRDALREYRAVVAGTPNAWSSIQQDPEILARYGDLCLRFSTVDEATRAYTTAAARSKRNDVHEPTTEGRGTSLAALRAAAHTAAAIQIGGSGRDEKALQELDIALSADPDFWVALYYRAEEDRRTGRMADASRDAAQAEALATPKGRDQVRWLRYFGRIPDLSGKLLPIQPVPGHRPGANPPPKSSG